MKIVVIILWIIIQNLLVDDSNLNNAFANTKRFMLEALDNEGGSNITNPIKYGSKITRSYYSRYMIPRETGEIGLEQKTPSNSNNLTLIVTDGTENNKSAGQQIMYGSPLYITASNGSYLRVDTAQWLAYGDLDVKSKFKIYDRFGQGDRINWARQGEVRSSSVSQQNPAYMAIDGNQNTYSESTTTEGMNTWFEVVLPRNIYIKDIVIRNKNSPTRDELGYLI